MPYASLYRGHYNKAIPNYQFIKLTFTANISKYVKRYTCYLFLLSWHQGLHSETGWHFRSQWLNQCIIACR